MNKLENFEKVHQEALAAIARFQQGPPEMVGLVEWMLTTDANPYAYLPEGWAGAISCSTGFAGLLFAIRHAVLDDGDITFVTVNGEPRIVFADKWDDNFRNYVLSNQEGRMVIDMDSEFDIKVLDISPNEFGALHDAFQAKWVKKCFMSDARRQGVDFAVKHYREYKCFNDSWIEEL